MISILISFIGFMLLLSSASAVLGGCNATPYEYPFLVSIHIFRTGKLTCAGTIISDSFILTAAHCLYGHKLTDIAIRTGKHNISIVEGFEQIRTATKFIIHEKYNYKEIDSPDIGLIKLFSKLSFTKAVKPIDILSKQAIPRGSGIVIGWGVTSDQIDPFFADILQRAIVPILSYDDCLRETIARFDFSDKFICTGPLTGIGPCYGDSGGPLVQGSPDKRIVVGVASTLYLQACGRAVPSVFTKISPYIHWIEENMK